MSESRLIYEVMQELGKHGAVFRTNAGTFYTRTGQRVSGMPKGFSDILYINTAGKACFVECKLEGNKASPEQLKFIEKMQRTGCKAGIAYSVNDALKICEIKESEIIQ